MEGSIAVSGAQLLAILAGAAGIIGTLATMLFNQLRDSIKNEVERADKLMTALNGNTEALRHLSSKLGG